MRVEVRVFLNQSVALPDTAVCRIEIRDVSRMDIPSVTLRSFLMPAKMAPNGLVSEAVFDLTDNECQGNRLDAWAHVSLTGEQRLQKGDYLTVRAYPINVLSEYISIDVLLQQI